MSKILFATIAIAFTAWCFPSVLQGADGKSEPPKVGDKVKDFELPVVGGDGYIELREEYKQGSVVVIVLRGFPGYQCPICSRQVGSLINRAKTIDGLAQRVILVYPGEGDELDRHGKQFIGSRKIPDPLVVVRDDNMEMVTEWGLRWDAPRETAYPATFVIDSNGRVRWAKISNNHSGRSSSEDVIKELRKL